MYVLSRYVHSFCNASQSPECCADLVGLGVGGGFLVAWVGAGALLRVEQHEVHLGPEQEAERHRGGHRHTHHQARDLDLGHSRHVGEDSQCSQWRVQYTFINRHSIQTKIWIIICKT